MIPLNNFETFCPDEILDRGKQYFDEGLIYSFEAIDPFRFAAIVIGSDPYAVSVELDDYRNIKSLHCTCPFDLGAICKHKVAVLHRVREFKEKGAPVSEQNLVRLAAELNHQGKGELVDFILRIASKSLEARQTIFQEAEVRDVWDPERFWIGDL